VATASRPSVVPGGIPPPGQPATERFAISDRRGQLALCGRRTAAPVAHGRGRRLL